MFGVNGELKRQQLGRAATHWKKFTSSLQSQKRNRKSFAVSGMMRFIPSLMFSVNGENLKGSNLAAPLRLESSLPAFKVKKGTERALPRPG
jgi:hypothetical protein